MIGRRREKLAETVKAVRDAGGEAISLVCDVMNTQDAQRAIVDTEKEFGCVNVLVNNAGILSVSNIESASEEEWDRVIATNLKGPFLSAARCCPPCAGLVGEVL